MSHSTRSEARSALIPQLTRGLGWLLLFALLWLPVELAAERMGDSRVRVLNLLACIGILLGIYSLGHWLRWGWLRVLLVTALLACLALRFLYYGLIHFSGAGFNLEFFLHLEWQSVRLAWQQYPQLLLGLAIAILALALLLLPLLHFTPPRPRRAAAGALIALALCGYSRGGLPEYQLLRAWQAWSSPLQRELDPTTAARWAAVDWLRAQPLPRSQLRVHVPEQPHNLIVLYLESLGTSLLDHPRWPGLTPKLKQLQARHALLPSMQASAFITIEGIINSQCGGLLPFQRDSETYASGERVFEELVCLGDVLKLAGFQQTYMGGAGMGFAGKGTFLREHGFDRTLGYEHWEEQGLQARPDTWGLSDADLFLQADLELDSLRESGQPYHLNLLTIGTHLPGFVYEECEHYQAAQTAALDESDRVFLDAIHCTDQLVGQWVARLQERGVLQDTLLVITADHQVFPNADMQRLFGDATDDRRLPLIVLGPVHQQPIAQTAASYDLAPTLLDLLGISHNATFMLGRSLLRPEAQRSYLVNRYYGVHEGQPIIPEHPCADASQPVQLPLDACSHAELQQVLAVATHALSRPPPQMTCDAGQTTGLRWDGQALQLLFADTPQWPRFTWNSRPLREARPGLYRLSIDPSGQVSERRFVPHSADAQSQGIHREVATVPGEAGLSLLLWLPDAEAQTLQGAELDELLPDFDLQHAAAWWQRHDGAVTQVQQDPTQPLELMMDQGLCQTLLEQRS